MDATTTMGLLAGYSILMGIVILAFWAFVFIRKRTKGPHESVELAYHVVGEIVTAVLLLVTGFGIAFEKDWALVFAPVPLGMLFYAMIVSPGFYAARKHKVMAVAFSLLALVTAIAIGLWFTLMVS